MDEIFIYRHKTWNRKDFGGFNVLVDITNVEELQSLPTENILLLTYLAAPVDTKPARPKLAILTQGDFHYGLAQLYQGFRHMNPENKREVQIFRSEKEALEFLGIGELGPNLDKD